MRVISKFYMERKCLVRLESANLCSRNSEEQSLLLADRMIGFGVMPSHFHLDTDPNLSVGSVS